MVDGNGAWVRQGEGFWRAHHEAWKRSDLNQRQYCEFHGLPQKAFENWRQKFRVEPDSPQRKLLYRRRGLSHPLSPPLSHPLSHVAYPSSATGPIVPRPREGHRRWFKSDETLSLTSAQLSLLIEGVDWRAPEQRWRPAIAG
jgi:hypothetical protein